MLVHRLAAPVFFGVCAFAGGIAGTSLLQPAQHAQAESAKIPPPPPPYVGPVSGPAALSERFDSVIRQVSPAVVSIEAVKPASATSKGKPVEESGSGVCIRLDGVKGTIVVTNNHVISGAKAEQITVHAADEKLHKPSRVWADPESDIAALLLDADDLPTANFVADSDKVHRGMWVLAFGSPFGLNQTVTHGIISARDRGQVSLGSTIRIKDFLQTDAAINPGSSGGPLVNLDAEVVGINTAIASNSNSNSGVSFSIPANMVRRVVKLLVEKGSVPRGYLGVQLATVLEPADALRLGLDKAQGALVEGIYPDTPAADAGLKQNDVILAVEGVTIRNENHLIAVISGIDAGRRVKLQVWRDRKSLFVETMVGDWNKAQSLAKAK